MAIKSKIYKIWDTAPIGVRICCIKFAQKLVLVQTPAPEDANRVCSLDEVSTVTSAHILQRADPADISASMVPTDHPLIPFSKLGAEAAGILDRMLSAFHEHAT